MTTNSTEAIRLIQSGLDRLGHTPGAIDGQWGVRTGRALKQLIAANGRATTVAPPGPLPWVTEAKTALGRNEARDRSWLMDWLKRDGRSVLLGGVGMKQMLDTVWQRRGVSWIWDNDAFASVATAAEVFSLRQLIRASKDWPDDLPSNDGKTLVVAGLDACLDLLSPTDAADWLNGEIKSAVLSFRDCYSDGAALIFWLPTGQRRLTIAPATDAVQWRCAAPHADEQIEFGRLLWGAAWDYPKEIILAQGGKPAGLFHLRIT